MNVSLSKSTRFLLAVGAQFIIIAAVILSKVSVIAGGTEVLLRIEPVDPRDLLRGDYATFQYEVSRIEAGLMEEGAAREGETVYVVLRRSGEVWNAARVVRDKPETGETFLRGKVTYSSRQAGGEIHILYGIEQYFIPEGAGASLPPWSQTDRAVARVAVDDQGNAVIQEILINGQAWPQVKGDA
jgi:uncharacterized membrane-anchored protein